MASPLLSQEAWSVGRALRWALVGQALLAACLVLMDLPLSALLQPANDRSLPAGPVTPGDQVRPYEPNRAQPDFVLQPDAPAVEFPDTLPARLTFTWLPDAGFGESLLLHGQIEAGDAQRFEAFLAGLSAPPERVSLHSPGGVISEALEIGHRLRALEADTILYPGQACVSACPYIFAAGRERRVSRQAALGMHQSYYETPALLPVFWAVKDIQASQGEVMQYVIDMGIDPGLMLYALMTPPEEIYVLVEEELLETRLATVITD